MGRERALQIVLVLTGVLFLALIYPLVAFFSREPAISMLMTIYVTWGIFLLFAARQPTAHRSLIAFAGWGNVAHAVVMAAQAYKHAIAQRELIGVAVFGIIGVVLIVLTPAKHSATQASAARA
ncbi:MAG TPA: DUF6632 domain-containing protein [Terriglobales bacterium]|nr:DUF6632 domain-containing protein [Terriglobales bacterium]